MSLSSLIGELSSSLVFCVKSPMRQSHLSLFVWEEHVIFLANRRAVLSTMREKYLYRCLIASALHPLKLMLCYMLRMRKNKNIIYVLPAPSSQTDRSHYLGQPAELIGVNHLVNSSQLFTCHLSLFSFLTRIVSRRRSPLMSQPARPVGRVDVRLTAINYCSS